MEYKDLISICIPTYEMKNYGPEYLYNSLHQIKIQTYPNIEVVISDHSLDDSVLNILEYFNELNIKYLKNNIDRGSSSSNINNAVSNASGDIVKILFQDDFLTDKNSITNQYKSLIESNNKWSITACLHYENEKLKDPFNPYFNKDILYKNTLSSPSTIMLYKDYFLEFDNNLLWYMDTDFYKRMFDNFGEPNICNTYNIANRRHQHQITKTLINDDVINFEKNYLNKKYDL